MTPAAARRLLPSNAARIARANEQLERLYAQRLKAFQVLSDDGMTQAEIGELAGTTPNVVQSALFKARKLASS